MPMNLAPLILPLFTLAATACIADFAPIEPLPSGDDDDAGLVTDARGSGGRGTPTGEGRESGDVASDDASGGRELDPSRGPCDLTGGWLVTERMMMNALGAKQVIVVWHFIELEQQGDQVVVSTSLMCGERVKGLPPILIEMDSTNSWKAYRERVRMNGRKGVSRAAGAGCGISFERSASLRGATVSTYSDFSVPLPMPSEQASGGTPGWEDWDGDGKPGVSLRISGSLSGTLYNTSRTWSEWSGTADPKAGSFTLGLKWQTERRPLGVSGSPLLAAEAGAPDVNASEHIAEFAAVTADQLGDTDEDRCARVRELARTLTPRAMK